MWASSPSSFPQHSPFSLCNCNPNLHSPTSTKTLYARGRIGDGDCPPPPPPPATLSIPPFHVKSITSTSNPFVKHCVKLRNSSSYRHSHGSVLLVGTTPLREIYKFKDNRTTIDCVLLHEKASVPEELAESRIHMVRVNSMVMKKLSGLQSTESIDAVSLVRIPSTFRSLDEDDDITKWFPSAFRVLVLDGIQDPGNLGTLIRSAVAFGWDGVFLLPGCCDPFNEKAIRASRGACFQVPMVSGRWAHLESLINGLQMKVLAGHPWNKDDEPKPISFLSYELARSLRDTKVCLILGSEGNGLSEKARRASELVSIRMSGEFESLNVSVAGGIFLFMLQNENKEV